MTLEWSQVHARHGDAVARVVASYTRPGPDREDLAQEIVAALLLALPRYRGEGSVKAYVLRIAHNTGLRHATRRRREQAEPLEEHAGEGNPEGEAARRERRERLHQAIRGLPISQRQVLTLVLEDLSHAEISSVLGISENAVAIRLHRARHQLRALLEAP